MLPVCCGFCIHWFQFVSPIAMAVWLVLVSPPVWIWMGTALPAETLAGTTTFNWSTPTNCGDNPENVTWAGTPPTSTVGAADVIRCASSELFPVIPGGLVGPNPVASSSSVSPGEAGWLFAGVNGAPVGVASVES